jgi:hypothetical protein
LNHASGNTELVSYDGAPDYTTLLHNGLTAYPAITDPENVKALKLDVNGDGVDELGFVRFNHSSGNTELVVYSGSPNYQTLVSAGPTGYPAITDPQNVTPIAFDVNGDGIDELGFVRFNHSSGNTELVVYNGAPTYTALVHAGPTGYPAVTDPEHVRAIALDTNGDGIDELGFVRFNHSSGNTEIVVYNGSPDYSTLLHAGPTGYPAIADPQNVVPMGIDLNGDRIDELGFVRLNHASGNTELVAYHGSPQYTTLFHSGLTAYPAISDPQNVTPIGFQAP